MTDDPADVDLLLALARGVIELAAENRAAMFRLPYPRNLQLALDRMVLTGLTHGHPVPTGVPELLSWCREEPPGTWLRGLPRDFLTADARLIHDEVGEPTRTCAELASFGSHGVLEQEALHLLANLADSCDSPQWFGVCRDFLIRHPVMLRVDPSKLQRPAVVRAWKLVKDLYTPVPERFVVEGTLHQCHGCRLLAKAGPAESAWCEGGCPPERRELAVTHQPEQARALPLSLRLFLALPGGLEHDVLSSIPEQPPEEISRLGVRRVIADNGVECLFHAQDREQPVPAARRAADVAAMLGKPMTVVVPDLVAERPGYCRSFVDELGTGTGVCLLSVSRFVALIRNGTSTDRRGNA